MAGEGATRLKRRAGSRNYDNPFVITYGPLGINDSSEGDPEHDFGNGALTFYPQPPGGAGLGQVMDIQVSVSETFNAVTTAGLVQVGISGELDKYAELSMGTAAAGASYGSYDVSIFDETESNPGFINFADDGATIITFVAPTGGTPAGKGYVFTTIGWW